MKKLDGKIDWTVAEDDEDWHASQSALQTEGAIRTEPAPRAVSQRELALAMLVVTLLLVLVGDWLWQRPDMTIRTSNPLQNAVIQEEQALTHTIALVDTSTQVVKIQRQSERIMAQVIVNYSEEGVARAYRETRFFEKNGDKWQRIDPDPTLMGALKILKIAHFTILYPAMDADAVYEVAPKLEQLYTGRDFGLPVMEATSVYTIELATSGLRSLYSRSHAKDALIVPSPALLSAPVEMQAGDLLYQALIYPLARQLVTDMIAHHSPQWQSNFAHWQGVPEALSLWALWQEGGALSASEREGVVRWLYKESVNKRIVNAPLLPDGYERLCHIYHIWLLTPSAVFVPLTCSDADKQGLSAQHYSTVAPSTLQRFYLLIGGATLADDAASSVLSETVFEYVAATYGREKMPLLIEALGEETTMKGLAPTVFGVSDSDFDAGWRDFVVDRYSAP